MGWLARLREQQAAGRAEAAKEKAEKAKPVETSETGDAVKLAKRRENAAAHAYPHYRVLVTVLLCSMGINMVLGTALMWSFPRMRVEPMFLHVYDYGTKVYDVEPLRGSAYTRSNAVLENIAQNYVKHRHEVLELPGVMTERWTERTRFVGAHSAGRVWDKFQEEAKQVLEAIRRQPFRRIINIQNIRRLKDGIWQYAIDFEAVESKGELRASEERKREYTATLTLRQGDYGPKGPTVGQARINAWGIYVWEYDVRPRAANKAAGG